MREEEEHKPDPRRNPIERNHMGLYLENDVAVVKTPAIISNKPVLIDSVHIGSVTHSSFQESSLLIFCTEIILLCVEIIQKT